MVEEKTQFEVKADSLAETQDFTGSIDYYIDPALERKYVRTIDTKLLPVLAAMYFCSAMDRSNVSNAYSDGMATDLHFHGQQYSLMLLLFYIPTALCDLPCNIITKQVGGNITLPILITCWGALTMIQPACKNFGGILALRLLIGAFEAGFFAGVIYYLTIFYTRRELAFRFSLFITASILAAAFTGLIAYAVFQIKGGPLEGWQYLFLIEGGATFLIGAASIFWLPKSPSTCRWLSDELKEVSRLRQLRNSSSKIEKNGFDWQACKARCKTWQWWVYFFISFTYPLPWTTASLFLTQIIGRFGFHTVKTNLWTVAPNLVGAVVQLCITFSSDRFGERAYHLCFALTLSLIGLIILATVDSFKHIGVSYFACFLLCCGCYVPSSLVHSWHNNNNLNESSRAFDSGVFVGLSNLASITASATFRTNYAPNYNPTIITTCISAGICWILSFSLGTWQKMENKKRNKEQGIQIKAADVDTSELKDGLNDPRWRYYT